MTMAEQTNEIICECGHAERDHIDTGCVILGENGEYICDCITSRSSVLKNAIAALQSTNEGQAETIRLMSEALEGIKQDAYDFVNDLAADVQEGGKFSRTELEKWSRVISACAILASTTPKDGQG